MKKALLAVAAASLVAAAGCGNDTVTDATLKPGHSYTFTSPTDGQVLRVGATVPISWSCIDCEGSDFTVSGFAKAGSASVNITARSREMSVPWVVGTTQSTVTLLPGQYRLQLTVCRVVGEACYWYNEVWGPTVTLTD